MALNMTLEFRSLDEPTLGPKWGECFHQSWPAYRRWFLSQGEAARPTYRQSVRALRKHMPEFLPTYERMTELAGGGDFAARFLGQFCPPPFFAACSQAILVDDEPVLIRNYDYSPLLCDGLIMKTRWQDQSVIAMTDCMSGVLDGTNESGLAISLAFGGRRVVGEGFGVTLVQRYVLENCTNVQQACKTICRIPIQVAYNIALVDKQGDHASVLLAPDKEPIVSKQRITTNHQPGQRWKKYTEIIESDTRFDFLQSKMGNNKPSPDELLDLFLFPPLYRTTYAMGYGTLFTSAYFPQRGEARYCWQDKIWRMGFNDFTERSCEVRYSDNDANVNDAPVWPPQHHAAARVPAGFISA